MAEKEEPAAGDVPDVDKMVAEQVIRDLPELDKLVSEQDKVRVLVAHCSIEMSNCYLLNVN